MTSHVKELVLLSLSLSLSLFNIAAAVSDMRLSTSHTTNKIHTQRSTSLLLTAKTISQPGIQLCMASVDVHSGKQHFMGCMRDFHGLFNIHVSSEHC
jgi:hypothetical protein